MEFYNRPQITNVLRTDCCTCLKGDNNQPISIRIKENLHKSVYLRIILSLKTNQNVRHFFKLFRLDEKIPKEERDRSTKYNINKPGEEIILNFFGIRKSKKEQALVFLKESFNNNNNLEQIFKENSSVAILEIILCENENEIHHLEHEIHIGSSNAELIIKHYTPKTLCDDGEITIKLAKKIKDDNDNVQLEVKDLNQMFIKKLLQPSKDVLVYKVPLNKIQSNKFEARLLTERNHSDFIQFYIRRSEPENFKRKASFKEESSYCKISRISSNFADCSKDCDKSIDTKRQVTDCDKSIDTKRQVTDNIQAKFLRKISRTAHDFAVGKLKTEEMNIIMSRFPLVCILQDDVGDTPLNNAILKNNEEGANILLDIVYSNFPEEINAFNSSGHTALILSPACDISLCFLKKLIDCGSNLLAVDNDGNSAMNIAIQYKKTDVLELLLNEIYVQNLNLTNIQLNSLLKDILKNEYFDGFELIANHYPIILENNNEFDFDGNQLMLYRNFVENFRFFCKNDDECVTPLAENSNEDYDILELLLTEKEHEEL